jgi:CO/xanthine dehydrogenase Mo-binding subunit/aerobic-type carbon monoxide dehydrogenase small subunit (CoxS/CutS family)
MRETPGMTTDPTRGGRGPPAAITIVVNGRRHSLDISGGSSLLSLLREDLGLVGAKYGCGEGVCGACTVLLDGEPVRSCVVPAEVAAGRSVTTVEGLAAAGRLQPVQQAFGEVAAMQCGYCTPGMIMAATALLAANPDPDEPQIAAALSGNVCRCCTYPRIVRAVRRAALSRAPSDRSAAQPDEPCLGRPTEPWNLVRSSERDWFVVLPDGMVVVVEAEPSGGSWSTSGEAWLHVDAHGFVTAFTGKVDVGQDNRTALSLLVAEELRVPFETVRLVMGDTDLCPYDLGTFGSRSIVDVGPLLRAAAAAAATLLRRAAAEHWSADPAGLEVDGGTVRERAGGRSIAYGELVRGERRVEIASVGTPLTPPRSWRIAGKRAPRRAALEIVTGAARYPTDLTRAGLLHGKILRPPGYGARLLSLDLSGARELAEVTVVEEGPFVGVAAPDPGTAERALRAIQAEWELEPQPSEHDLVEHLRSHPIEAEGWDGPFHEEVGDVEEALAEASVRLERTYTTAFIAHMPLETRAALADWDGDRLTVWMGTQRPFGVREQVALELGIPEEQVRVIAPTAGGGFGGKHTGEVAIEAARLARATGRPVKVRWSREEELSWGYVRPAAVIDVRSGANSDGTITAWALRNLNSGTAGILSPYTIPNQRIDFQPAASPLRQGSYRALAATANHFARESHLDELADCIRVDPLELRLRHLRDERLADVFRAAAERAGWDARSRGEGVGVGIAGGVEKDSRVATCAEVQVDGDGRLEIRRIVTAFDCGPVVDPDNLVNQIEGATVMGLGAALFEAVHFADGRILNASLSQYRVPRFTDVPPIDVVLLDRPDADPAGAGETPIVAVAPAIANAIFAACGTRIRSLPLAPAGIVAGSAAAGSG